MKSLNDKEEKMKEQKANAESNAKEKDGRIAQLQVGACTINMHCVLVYTFAVVVYCMCGIAGKAKVIKIVVCTEILCHLFHKNVLHYVFE